MPIIARASSHGENFAPAPQGMHRAICCDVCDLGMVPGKWGEKHLVRIVWQIETLMSDGKPFMVDQRYTLTLDERANLRKDLEAWRGKPFTLTEAAGFDLERLIGVPCSLIVLHKPGREAGKVFANVQRVLPAQPGAKLVIRDYTRIMHRQAAASQTPPSIGPSYPPEPPQRWPARLPESPTANNTKTANNTNTNNPFDAQAFEEAQALTAEDIPFAWLLPLMLPICAMSSLLLS
jgi:hypothetical protein